MRKFRNIYQLRVQFKETYILKDYVKLAWAHKSFKKFKSYSNTESAMLVMKTPGLCNVVISDYVKPL